MIFWPSRSPRPNFRRASKTSIESHHYQRKLSEAKPGARTPSSSSRKPRSQLVQSEKTRVARPHERGHHPRNQQSAEFRDDRPVHPAQQGQTARAGTARASTRKSSTTSRKASSGCTTSCPICGRSRTRTADPVEPVDVDRGREHLAAFPEQRMEGQGANRAEAAAAQTVWPTGTN